MWLHFCGRRCCAPADTGAVPAGGALGRPNPIANRRRPYTVDLHCHVLTPAVEALVAKEPRKLAEPERMRRAMGDASVAHNLAVMLPAAFPKLTRVEQRLADMDAMGVDLQVVSPSPNQFYYWAGPALARDVVRLQNEGIAALCAQHPDRLQGLGTVALQHPALAIDQLQHALGTLGLKGVEISTSVEGRELDHPSLEPFWDRAEALDALVFIHPFGSTLGERASTHYLDNVIGQPLETTIALSRLIFGGVLDRHPHLKIVAAHGGGYLPTSIGRSNHGRAVRPEAATTARSPVEYLRDLHFDTVVHDTTALRHLIEVVGISQVVAGTDYPYDMGHFDPHGLLGGVSGLGDAERALVLGGNARRLLGMPVVAG